MRTEDRKQGEGIDEAILREIRKEQRFLILDNLLDTQSPEDYLAYILQLAQYKQVTLLITSRNADLSPPIRTSTPRHIHRHDVGGLDPAAARELFKKEFLYRSSSTTLGANADALEELLRPLNGIPLAIQLVAAYARSQPSFKRVIQNWKRQWKTGAWDRDEGPYSLKATFDLSFSDAAFKVPATVAFLTLLALLPFPILLSCLPDKGPISVATKAILRSSIGKLEITGEEGRVRILEPVREDVLRRWSADFDTNNDTTQDIMRTLAISYFTHTTNELHDYEYEEKENSLSLVNLTEGMAGNGMEAARVGALLSYCDVYGTHSRFIADHLIKLLETKDTAEFSFSGYKQVLLFVILTVHFLSILEEEESGSDSSLYWLDDREPESPSKFTDSTEELLKTEDAVEFAFSGFRRTRVFRFITRYFPATSLPSIIRFLTPETQTQALEAALEQAKRCELKILSARILNVMGELARRVDESLLEAADIYKAEGKVKESQWALERAAECAELHQKQIKAEMEDLKKSEESEVSEEAQGVQAPLGDNASASAIV
ncbi:hypothetical protein P7C70_g5935, partial [Phenoliferia sp. Uapishka_3]